jgi:hypothetical protein
MVYNKVGVAKVGTNTRIYVRAICFHSGGKDDGELTVTKETRVGLNLQSQLIRQVPFNNEWEGLDMYTQALKEFGAETI